jgi:S-(hydroxymethyl)glutathione dehydrogenase / alcohol dehydrogenase
MKAAIFYRPHEPLRIESVTVDNPQDREVLVRTAATGVCHSDLHYVDGDLPGRDHPMVMGHQQFPLRPNIPIRAMSEGSLGTI